MNAMKMVQDAGRTEMNVFQSNLCSPKPRTHSPVFAVLSQRTFVAPCHRDAPPHSQWLFNSVSKSCLRFDRSKFLTEHNLTRSGIGAGHPDIAASADSPVYLWLSYTTA